MAQVLCEVSEGLRDSERTVAVKDIYGHRQFLRVENEFLTREKGKHYLPVGIVHLTRQNQALIELPHEADSGAHRLWVRCADLLDPVEAKA